MNKAKIKVVAGSIIILLTLVFLVFTGMRESFVYYFTVSELLEKKDSLYGRGVRVAGKVEPGSIVYDSRNLNLEFNIMDDSHRVRVIYHGILPDLFKDNADVVVEGEYHPSGLFKASQLLAKCPSKYEARYEEKKKSRDSK